jgi:hypothetical protein
MLPVDLPVDLDLDLLDLLYMTSKTISTILIRTS